ncbi:hypothetical protein I5M27_07990 [Adhaeribacter sp. BT258]|uniref:Carbohydrate binding domain-containing protein n=1 Tax=Adhaeribacter terrigena TaxID=2793070 RepID=A0ABS1C0J0_9BACT|nr:hypothetical protein [Adhaeribacter terrigena]MBK0402924.1 hypothetical protein [Adhaeribacter terrigena]
MRFRSVVFRLLPVMALSVLSGCEIINPTEDTPSYLKINSIPLDPRKNATESYGSASNNIVDAWVFANKKIIGCFELPATIPILADGNVEIDVYAGIYGDGQKAARFPFAFYTQYDTTVLMEPGKVTDIAPKVKFESRTVLPFDVYEDFSAFPATPAIRVVPNSPYKLVVNQDSLTDYKYANGTVGVVYGVAGQTSDLVLESLFNGKLPQGNAPVFLEFDYRSTRSFKVGVSATPVGGNAVPILDLTLNPTRQWTKMYVNLTEEVNITGLQNANFRMLWQVSMNGNPSDYFAIDNIRLIHF